MLEALGNLGDFLGGIAVLVTLAYLAVQMRHNTRLIRESAQLARAHALASNETRSILLSIAQHGDLTRVFRQGLTDYASLEGEDRMRFDLAFGALVGGYSSNFTQESAFSMLSDANPLDRRFGASVDGIGNFLNTPGGRIWWQRFRHSTAPEFRAFIDRSILGSEDALDEPEKDEQEIRA